MTKTWGNKVQEVCRNNCRGRKEGRNQQHLQKLTQLHAKQNEIRISSESGERTAIVKGRLVKRTVRKQLLRLRRSRLVSLNTRKQKQSAEQSAQNRQTSRICSELRGTHTRLLLRSGGFWRLRLSVLGFFRRLLSDWHNKKARWIIANATAMATHAGQQNKLKWQSHAQAWVLRDNHRG